MSHNAAQYSNVRNTLRELGRLLLRLRKTVGPGCAPLSDFLHPNHFKGVIQDTKEVAGFNEETHLIKTPSLALKIGTSETLCCNKKTNWSGKSR